jgi:hypothetical protein
LPISFRLPLRGAPVPFPKLPQLKKG